MTDLDKYDLLEECIPDESRRLRIVNRALEDEIVSLKDLLQECYKRFELYEMDADTTPPHHHVYFMKRVKAALAS